MKFSDDMKDKQIIHPLCPTIIGVHTAKVWFGSVICITGCVMLRNNKQDCKP